MPRAPSSVVIREVTIALSAFFVYFLVRGLTDGRVDLAMENGQRLVDFEKAIGMYHEEWLQSFVVDNALLTRLLNWIYIYGHWPVIVAVALWLLITQPAHYRLMRNAFLISGGIGLIIFATFPVAPPRLLEIGLVDTVVEHSNAYRVLQPPIFVNQYAAMPSLHFGWDLLIGIALVRYSRVIWLQGLGVLLPVAMLLAVVLTANHYIIDVVAGGLVALIGLWLATLLMRSDEERRARAVAPENARP